MTKEERQNRAREYFKQGYNCAQAVVLAFREECGLDEDRAAAVASGFGGGMGRMREVCGAVSGAILVLNLTGWDAAKAADITGRTALYPRVQQLMHTFQEQNHSYICRELLGVSAPQTPVPAERTAGYYKKRPCPELVADAAGILWDMGVGQE